MSTPIFNPVVLLATLAACNPSPDRAPGNVDKDNQIACAVGGATEFAEMCEVERVTEGGSQVLVVHHPNGSFRRFDVLAEGRGLAVSDGAIQAVATYGEDLAELAVGPDRYRFPIRLKDNGTKP